MTSGTKASVDCALAEKRVFFRPPLVDEECRHQYPVNQDDDQEGDRQQPSRDPHV